jgi:nucleoside-triphosphatase THEP1
MGPVHSGKTTLLKNTILVLRKKNFSIDGYLSESVWENEEILGYNLFDLRDLRSFPFIRKQGQEDGETIGPFSLLPETLEIAKKIIRRSPSSDLCVVDEVGPLELTGRGVWPALKDVLRIPEQDILLVVRRSILKSFLQKIQRNDFVVYDIEQEKTPSQMAASVLRGLNKGAN